METGRTIGILGGTFDPIHNGHLLAAEWAREAFKLDELIFIPAARPPHKDLQGVLESRHRYRMVELAIGDNPGFSVSPIELERAGYSYTVDTITHYLQTYPGIKIQFIIGIDALQIIYTWKDLDRLLTLCRFIVVTRPGYELDKKAACFQSVPAEIWERTEFLVIPALEISSSDIRRRVAHGKTIKYLLPSKVEKYIKDNCLYQGINGETYE